MRQPSLTSTSRTTDTWQFWVDRGGTFTDIIAHSSTGEIRNLKLLSENPQQYPDAAIAGIRRILNIPAVAPIPSERISCVKMGTTVATNALLERKGEPSVLVTSKGFRDVLRIGYQNRPKLFDLNIQLPEMLYSHVIEANERVSADGGLVCPLDDRDLTRQLSDAYAQGYRTVAIVFLHGYRFGVHEQQAAALAESLGFTQVSTSHETSPLVRFVSRGDTTVANAYLTPILHHYVQQVSSELQDVDLQFMQSSGGLTDAFNFQGKDSVLSGPAGGVIGMVKTAAMNGIHRVIGFDMGGTSTDVAHYNNELERSLDNEVAGVRILAPMMQIHTVAAGGGSILEFDGSRLKVGPESAGANPGPACYRNGGPLAVTDIQVMLGRLQPDFFPKIFGSDGNRSLDTSGVRQQFQQLAETVSRDSEQSISPVELAQGYLQIAVDNMANAIKKISVQKGHDVSDYTLQCFGGAGGQHACAVARSLGMKSILIHPLAGLLSAYGIGLAETRIARQKTAAMPLSESTIPEIEQQLSSLAETAWKELAEQGFDSERIATNCEILIRYEGSDATLPVRLKPCHDMVRDFEQRHRLEFGFAMTDKPVIAETLGVEAVASGNDIREKEFAAVDSITLPEPLAMLPVHFDEGEQTTPFYDRSRLLPGHSIPGPAIITEETGTTVIEPGWTARITNHLHLLISQTETFAEENTVQDISADPIRLEVFNNLFMNIAEQMGLTLARTATSVNIKERLDFSCALFDDQGQLIANAPHMPVHLGSMGESVKAIIKGNQDRMKPGDVYIVNSPFHGGTHIPDVTAVTPVFNDDGGHILFYTASRGHHADIGGTTPGSMPSDSVSIDQEGILIENFKLVDQGQFREKELVELFTSPPWPARNISQNIADLKAQVAANECGIRELRKAITHFGLTTVQAYMRHVQTNAETSVRRLLKELPEGQCSLKTDKGDQIQVRVSIDRQNLDATVDFTGTSAQASNNFNAPLAVTRAAVLYVFRTLVGEEIPLNAGCLKPINLIVPENSLLNPSSPAAVVAGNVETSQHVTDALLQAVGALAGSQGTMNNLTFGNKHYQYYETLCGGAGAGDGFNGANAVHTHMTNSRLTDPEILENRFPVRLESFSIREGSGGKGKYNGGDGVIRRIRFLEPMTASLLTSHRSVAPSGINGGGDGSPGTNRLIRADGQEQLLAATESVDLGMNDQLEIATPGGGGFGMRKQ
ncbi:MAG: hydantoinase B/oxoprolinase family protein [Endozoicomonas sp.]